MNTRVTQAGVEVTSTKLKVNQFSFLINGIPRTSVPAFIAVTKNNGDGDDRIFSNYTKTTSKKILSLSLVLSEEKDEQAESLVKTAKGNTYTSSCSFNGDSG